MKLGEIITGRAGGVYEAPTRAIRFKILGRNAQGAQVVADAHAVLAFISEDSRGRASADAEKEMRRKFPEGNAPADLLIQERIFHLLVRALRDADDDRQPFTSSPLELKSALQKNVAEAIFIEYGQFCADEFPDAIKEETFNEL